MRCGMRTLQMPAALPVPRARSVACEDPHTAIHPLRSWRRPCPLHRRRTAQGTPGRGSESRDDADRPLIGSRDIPCAFSSKSSTGSNMRDRWFDCGTSRECAPDQAHACLHGAERPPAKWNPDPAVVLRSGQVLPHAPDKDVARFLFRMAIDGSSDPKPRPFGNPVPALVRSTDFARGPYREEPLGQTRRTGNNAERRERVRCRPARDGAHPSSTSPQEVATGWNPVSCDQAIVHAAVAASRRKSWR